MKDDVEEGCEAEEVELENGYVDLGGTDNIDDIVQDMYSIGPQGWDSTEEDEEDEEDGNDDQTPDTTERSGSFDDKQQTLPMETEYQEESQWKQEKKDHMEMQRKLLEENAGGMDEDSVGEVSSDDDGKTKTSKTNKDHSWNLFF